MAGPVMGRWSAFDLTHRRNARLQCGLYVLTRLRMESMHPTTVMSWIHDGLVDIAVCT